MSDDLCVLRCYVLSLEIIQYQLERRSPMRIFGGYVLLLDGIDLCADVCTLVNI